jgi:cobalt-zinc-cadmium efflux system outer membrane protein
MKTSAILQIAIFALCAPVASAQQTHSPASARTGGTLTLSQALSLALEKNPDLTVFAQEIRAADARLLQARALPNPEVSVEVENVAGSREFSGTRSADWTFQLSQLIELGGKRQQRERQARLAGTVAALDYEVKRLEVFGEVAREFIAVLAAQRRLAWADEAVRMTEQFAPAAQKRVDAGAASQVELLRFNLQIAAARSEREQAHRELSAARKRLAALWGEEPNFDAVAGDLEKLPDAPLLEKVRAQLAQTPALKRWDWELQRRNAEITAAQSDAKPDVTVGVGVRHLGETNNTAAVVSVSIPLPLFNRNQGAVQQARIAADKAAAERRATETRARTQLSRAFDDLASAQRQIQLLKETILPQAREAFEKVNDGYRAGRFSYLEIVDAQNTLITANLRYIEALAAYQQTVAEIESLTGQPLGKLIENK